MGKDPTELYKIIFDGELFADISREEVEANLRERFKFSEAALERMFSGRTVILKSDLEKETADRYARGLWQAGARCRVEQMVSSVPIDRVHLATPSKAKPATMVCPRCGAEQAEGLTCQACGVVVEKFRQRQEENALGGQFAPASMAPAAAPGRGVVTDRITAALAGTKPWVLVVAVVIFISSCLGMIGALASALVVRRHGMAGMALFIQVPLLLINLISSYFLFRYSNAIGAFLEGESVPELELALERQKTFWKFVGILSVVGIIIGVFFIGAAIFLPLLIRRF